MNANNGIIVAIPISVILFISRQLSFANTVTQCVQLTVHVGMASELICN